MDGVLLNCWTNKIIIMAIDFIKNISSDKLLMAYNNNIVEFKSDNTIKTQLKANIFVFGFNVELYPGPQNTFWFNFYETISAAINTNNFQDNVVTDINGADPDSIIYDAKDGCFLSGTITFKITFTDNTFETTTKDLKFIAGVEQLDTFKKNEIIISENDYLILSPLKSETNNTNFLVYWAGYPFEFSYFTNYPADQFTLKNEKTNVSSDFTSKSNVNAIALSDGSTDFSIEDFIPMVLGLNKLLIIRDSVLQDNVIEIEKREGNCGVYLKWLNKYGRYNYWLFSNKTKTNRSSKYGPELDNDFNNLEDTIAPLVQTGKTSQDTIKVYTDNLYREHKELLNGILESPKIYLFTGVPFSKANANDWIEVNLKTTSNEVSNFYNTVKFKMELDIELPTRYAQRL